MYRTNAQSRAIEEAFIEHNIRYRVVGGTRFYDRREVRDLLAYFRTWSPLLTYHEKHPEDLQRAEDTRFLAEDLARAAGDTGALRFCGVER